ncbi:MAG: two pore domain potassium channel family protein [Deltaproteobacteria bacterium]|nr:two pore domain potassium channel family protein [Deltaproteobacteria bacterium]
MGALKFKLRMFLAILVFNMIVGTLGFMLIEKQSLLDSFYFTVVTVATVGYGDIHPVTSAGKILVLLVIITGVGTFVGVVANGTEIFMTRRDEQSRLQKLHMVIGLFFSELGTRLLVKFSAFDPQLDQIRADLIVTSAWTDAEFDAVSARMKSYNYEVDTRRGSLPEVRGLLKEKGDFLVRLLENPSLLEHEIFTDLMRAIFHLREELLHRPDVSDIPDEDHLHLSNDIKRAYLPLVLQWLQYMKYLRPNYPFLFNFAMKTNPFARARRAQ